MYNPLQTEPSKSSQGTAPPISREINEAIMKMKVNKLPSPDSLNSEFFKCSTSVLVPILTPIIRDIWTNYVIPDCWKKGVIVTISK
jgi:hypothetical protein